MLEYRDKDHTIILWREYRPGRDVIVEAGHPLWSEAVLLDPAPYVAPDPRLEWRQRTALSRMDFCLAIKRAGILSGPEAVAASKGDMPAVFASAVEAAEQDVDEAAIVWAAARQIERAHPLIELTRLHLGWTHEQVDTLFGWQE